MAADSGSKHTPYLQPVCPAVTFPWEREFGQHMHIAIYMQDKLAGPDSCNALFDCCSGFTTFAIQALSVSSVLARQHIACRWELWELTHIAVGAEGALLI